ISVQVRGTGALVTLSTPWNLFDSGGSGVCVQRRTCMSDVGRSSSARELFLSAGESLLSATHIRELFPRVFTVRQGYCEYSWSRQFHCDLFQASGGQKPRTMFLTIMSFCVVRNRCHRMSKTGNWDLSEVSKLRGLWPCTSIACVG